MAEKKFNTALGRFRFIGLSEGISFLVLLGIAMPLKHAAGFPEAVKLVGWIHGLLFILYIAALVQVAFVNTWSLTKVVVAFIASLIPFGTFWFDKRFLVKEQSLIKESL